MKTKHEVAALEIGDTVELNGRGGTYAMAVGTRQKVMGIGGSKRRRIYFLPIHGTGHFGMFWRYELHKVSRRKPRP